MTLSASEGGKHQQNPMADEWNSTRRSSPLAKSILQRHARAPFARAATRASMLLRRIERWSGPRLPLLTTIQRRWSPLILPAWRGAATLPFLQFASAAGPTQDLTVRVRSLQPSGALAAQDDPVPPRPTVQHVPVSVVQPAPILPQRRVTQMAEVASRVGAQWFEHAQPTVSRSMHRGTRAESAVPASQAARGATKVQRDAPSSVRQSAAEAQFPVERWMADAAIERDRELDVPGRDQVASPLLATGLVQTSPRIPAIALGRRFRSTSSFVMLRPDVGRLVVYRDEALRTGGVSGERFDRSAANAWQSQGRSSLSQFPVSNASLPVAFSRQSSGTGGLEEAMRGSHPSAAMDLSHPVIHRAPTVRPQLQLEDENINRQIDYERRSLPLAIEDTLSGIGEDRPESSVGEDVSTVPEADVTSETAGDMAPDADFDADELAERVMNKFLRMLAVEGERRGWRQWL